MSIEYPDTWVHLKYPNLRAELLALLEEVAARGPLKEPVDIDDLVHFLFDDTWIADAGKSTVGEILMDENEESSVRALTRAISDLVDELEDVPTAKYVAHPLWPQIRHLAELSLDLLLAHGQPQYF